MLSNLFVANYSIGFILSGYVSHLYKSNILSRAWSSPLVMCMYLQSNVAIGDCTSAVSYFATRLNMLQGR